MGKFRKLLNVYDSKHIMLKGGKVVKDKNIKIGDTIISSVKSYCKQYNEFSLKEFEPFELKKGEKAEVLNINPAIKYKHEYVFEVTKFEKYPEKFRDKNPGLFITYSLYTSQLEKG
jgi:hypothetical protein